MPCPKTSSPVRAYQGSTMRERFCRLGGPNCRSHPCAMILKSTSSHIVCLDLLPAPLPEPKLRGRGQAGPSRSAAIITVEGTITLQPSQIHNTALQCASTRRHGGNTKRTYTPRKGTMSPRRICLQPFRTPTWSFMLLARHSQGFVRSLSSAQAAQSYAWIMRCMPTMLHEGVTIVSSLKLLDSEACFSRYEPNNILRAEKQGPVTGIRI